MVKKAELEAKNAKLKSEKAEFINFIKKDYTNFEAYIVKLKHLSWNNQIVLRILRL